jgi:hypothetical protein
MDEGELPIHQTKTSLLIQMTTKELIVSLHKFVAEAHEGRQYYGAIFATTCTVKALIILDEMLEANSDSSRSIKAVKMAFESMNDSLHGFWNMEEEDTDKVMNVWFKTVAPVLEETDSYLTDLCVLASLTRDLMVQAHGEFATRFESEMTEKVGKALMGQVTLVDKAESVITILQAMSN